MYNSIIKRGRYYLKSARLPKIKYYHFPFVNDVYIIECKTKRLVLRRRVFYLG